MNSSPFWTDLTVTGPRIHQAGDTLDLTDAAVRLVGGQSGGGKPFHLELVVNGEPIGLTDPHTGLLRPHPQLQDLAAALRDTGDPDQLAIAERVEELAERGVLALIQPAEPSPENEPLHQTSPIEEIREVPLAGAELGLSIAAGIVIRPVLVIRTPEQTTQVELAHPLTGTVQPAGELTALADTIEAIGTADARHTADQIRQVAGWRQLPRDFQLVIDVGAGPAPAQPATPSRPKLIIDSPRRARWHTLRMLLFIPLSILTCLTSFNVGALSRGEQTRAEVRRTGTALVTGCHTAGPISQYGLGMWTTCTAQVSWSDGTTETRTADRNFFTSEEVGKQIDVGEIRAGCRSGCKDFLIREERPVNGGYIAAFLALVVLSVVLAMLGFNSRAALRYWRRRRKLPTQPGRSSPDRPLTGRLVRINRIDEVTRTAPEYARSALAAALDLDQGTLTFPAAYPIHLNLASVRLTCQIHPNNMLNLDLVVDGQTIALFDQYDGVLRDEPELTALATALRDTGVPEQRRSAEALETLADRGVVALLPPGEQSTLANTEWNTLSATDNPTKARRRYHATIAFGSLRTYLGLTLAVTAGWQATGLLADGGSALMRPALQSIALTAVASLGAFLLLRSSVRRIRTLLSPARIDGDSVLDRGRRAALRDTPSQVTVVGGSRRGFGWFGPWPVLPVLIVTPLSGPVIRVPLADPATGALLPAAELTRLAGLLPNPTTVRHIWELVRWRRLTELAEPVVIDSNRDRWPS